MSGECLRLRYLFQLMNELLRRVEAIETKLDELLEDKNEASKIRWAVQGYVNSLVRTTDMKDEIALLEKLCEETGVKRP